MYNTKLHFYFISSYAHIRQKIQKTASEKYAGIRQQTMALSLMSGWRTPLWLLLLMYLMKSPHGAGKEEQKLYSNCLIEVKSNGLNVGGCFNSIHPEDKQDVAFRLVLGARAVAYGEKNVSFQGPFPTQAVLDNSYVTIVFNQDIKASHEDGFFEVR